MDGSFWVQPFQSSANWITSGALITSLRGGTPSVNQTGNFSPPYYQGKPTDPNVTVTDGTKTITVRLPLGAIPEGPTSAVDQSIGGSDQSRPYLVWSGSDVSVNTGSVQASGTVITVGYGMAIQDGSGLMMVDAVTGTPGDNNSFGNIQDWELSQISASSTYVMQKMLAFQLDISQARPGTAGTLAWPLNAGDGGATYTGQIPQGVTIGIPASTVRPTGKSRGFYALFDQAQQFGLFNYNFGAVGGVNLCINSFSGAYASLVADLVASWPQVAQFFCILNYNTGVSGAQYSLATTKGAIPGSTNAFPAPPPLDLSPTGGVNVAPSTFQAWYPSGYNATPTNSTAATPSLTIVTPTQQNSGSAFSVTGGILSYTNAPTLFYRVDSGTWGALPAGATVTNTTFTFSVPGLAAGTHTVSVEDSNNTAVVVSTGTFPVVTAVVPTITVTAPSFPAAGQAFTLSGSMLNEPSTPSLTVSDNSSSPAPLPAGNVVSASAFSFLHAALAAGTYTTAISDGSNAGSATFTVTAITGGASLNGSSITTTTSSLNDSAGNRWSIAAGGQVALDGVVDTTTSNVIEMAWVSGDIWYENSSNLWRFKTTATGTWQPTAGTTTNPLTSLPTITINAIPSPQPNTPFSVSGSMQNEPTVPTLTFADNSGPATALPTGNSVSLIAFSFTHPGMPSGTDTLVVSDGIYSSSPTSYTVVTPGFNSLPPTSNLTNTITGLTASTLYTAQVYATNSVGQGPPSATITFTTPAASLVAPGVPTGLTSTAITTGSVTLSWTAPTSGSSPITYLPQRSLHGANTWTNGPTVSSTSAQIVGLASGASYDFQVEAINSVGTSAFSTIFTVSTSGSAPVAVTWSAASASSTIALTNTNLTATAGGPATLGATNQGVLSSAPVASGNVSWEITLSSITQNCELGLAGGSFTMANALGLDANSIGYNPTAGALLPLKITPGTGTITDGSGNVWSIDSGANLVENGTAIVGGAQTGAAEFYQNVMYFQDQSSGGWFTYNGSLFVAATVTPPTPSAGQPAQSVYFNNVEVLIPSGNAPGNDVGGAVFTFCATLTGGAGALLWYTGPAMQARYGANTWNCSATANPATGVGGIPFSISGAVSIVFHTQESGGVAVLNAGSSAFSRAGIIPSNFPAWNGSAIAVVIPGAVTALTAGTPTNVSVPLSWTAPTTGTPPLTYHIMRSPTGANTFAEVATSATTSTTAGGLTAATGYDFRVFAGNSGGNGANSNTVSATTASTASTGTPGAPSGVSASAATSSSVTLSWVPPGSSLTPPAAAAAVGYNTLTYGPTIAVNNTVASTSYPSPGPSANNNNWYPFTFYGTSWQSVGFTVNADLSVTLDGSGEGENGYGLSTIALNGTSSANALSYTGVAFGGGMFAQVVMLGNGPMAFWSNDAETMNGVSIFPAAGLNPWPGHSGWFNWFEGDFAEFDLNSGPGGVGVAYGVGTHNWYNNGGSNLDRGSNFTKVVPVPFPNYNSYNTYAMLWVPATSTTQGYLNTYFAPGIGGTLVQATHISWDKFNSANAPPPFDSTTSYNQNVNWPTVQNGGGASTTAFSILDQLHLGLIISGYPGFTTKFQSLQVWQASAAGNIPVVVPAGSATSYQVQYKLSTASTFTNFGSTTTALTQVITGLSPSSTYNFQVVGINASGAGPASSPVVTSATTAGTVTANFTVSAGSILTPTGTVFRGKGININDGQNVSSLFTFFPGLGLIRFAAHAYVTPASIAPFITLMTNAKVPVIIEDHTSIGQQPYTGSQGATQLAWYSSHATAFNTNPYVWFGTQNEAYPTVTGNGDDITTHHVNVYNTVRNAGNNTIVLMDPMGGGNPNELPGGSGPQLTKSRYAPLLNVGWDYHFYNWVTNDSNDRPTILTAFNNLIAELQTITSGNGVIPIVVGEYGVSTTGDLPDDVGGTLLVDVVGTSHYPSAAWHWNAGGASDNLTSGSPGVGGVALTTFGTQVAALIAAG